MSRREITFSEGTSNKFWAIELDDKSHTVNFGRIGTSGQTQTKEFASEDAARNSYDKLIAEKTKKGYTEATASAKTAPDKTKPDKVKKAAAPESIPAVAKEAESVPAAKVNTAVTHKIDLDPKDWFWATWRKLKPLERGKPRPFDIELCCLELIGKKRAGRYGQDNQLPTALSPEEAHFWFQALALRDGNTDRVGIANRLRKQRFIGKVARADIKKAIKKAGSLDYYFPSLVHLLSPREVINLFLDRDIQKSIYGFGPDTTFAFHDHLLPYLSEKDRADLREYVRPMLDPDTEPAQAAEPFPPEFYLGAMLGCHDELRTIVRSWPDDKYGSGSLYDPDPQVLVFGLGDPNLVESEMRRLNLQLYDLETRYMRAWLAHTECTALDMLVDCILPQKRAHFAEKDAQVLALVNAPEAAEPMLKIYKQSKAPKVGRQWLDEEVGNAIPGLIPVAAGKGKLAEAAVEYLRDKKRAGFESLIADCLKKAPPEVAAKVKGLVLEHKEKVYSSLDDKSTPSWLKSALKDATKLTAIKGAEWLDAGKLPPLVVGERRLGPEQVQAVLLAVQNSELAKPHSLRPRRQLGTAES
jgi:predicted DNA-binding WGR domain protein